MFGMVCTSTLGGVFQSRDLQHGAALCGHLVIVDCNDDGALERHDMP